MLTTGIVRKKYLNSEGRLRAEVISSSGSIYYSVAFGGVSGGNRGNFSHEPVSFSSDTSKIDLDDFKGAYVLLFHPEGGQTPVIIGTLPPPLREETENTFFSEERSFDADDKQDLSKITPADEHRTVDGSVRVMGAEGITLDTQENSKPVRLQVSSDSHVRISQTNQDTSDHVVLSSHLMTKLTQLETALITIAAAVNGINAAVANIHTSLELVTGGGMEGGAPVPLTSLNQFVFQSEELPEDIANTPWSKGGDGSYQADCLRISNKNTE